MVADVALDSNPASPDSKPPVTPSVPKPDSTASETPPASAPHDPASADSLDAASIPSFDDNPSASLKMHAATSHDTVEANLLANPHANEVFPINHLSRDTQRVLWHQHLAHCNARRLSDAHKFIKGVPKLPITTEINNCAICIAGCCKDP
jgi:hypothetical protein